MRKKFKESAVPDEGILTETVSRIKELEKEAKGGSNKAHRAKKMLYEIGMEKRDFRALEAFLKLEAAQAKGKEESKFDITADDLIGYTRRAEGLVRELDNGENSVQAVPDILPEEIRNDK